MDEPATKTKGSLDEESFNALPFADLSSRGILPETVKFYNVREVTYGDDRWAVLPYYHNTKLVNVKLKSLTRKGVYRRYGIKGSEENTDKYGLFGSQKFAPSDTSLTITEGEFDAMSAYQMQQSKYPHVSICNGASSAPKDVKTHFEYIQGFKGTHVICFDSDAPGRDAAEKVASILSVHKPKVMRLDENLKDANGYLMSGRDAEYRTIWWKSSVWTPENVVPSSSLKAEVLEKSVIKSVPWPFEILNEKVGGIQSGKLYTFIAQTGIGKSQFLREISYHLATQTDARIGLMHLEESPAYSATGLLSIHLDKRLHLEQDFPKAKIAQAFDEVLGDDRVFFYDAFGSNDIEDIFKKIDYFAKGLDCKYVFLDHMSMLTSSHENLSMDERKTLDFVAHKLMEKTRQLGITIFNVVHANDEGKSRGSRNINKVSDLFVSLHRDVTAEDEQERNIMKVLVEKARHNGSTGPAGDLYFVPDTGRLVPLSEVSHLITPPTEHTEKGI